MERTRQPDQKPKTTSSVAPPPPERERQPGLRAVGVAASRLAGPIIARSGGGILSRLKSRWASIVGPEFAATTWPDALARDGILKLRVASAAALEVQHRAPLVIERINLFFGRAAITRLALTQGPLPLPPPPARPAPAALPPAEAQMLNIQVADIADGELREALARLGRAVITTSRDRG